MPEQLKNTLEVYEFLEYAAPKLIQALKDGVQPQDLAVLMDPAMWTKAQAALADIELVKAEVSPLDFDKAEILAVRSLRLGKMVHAALANSPA